MRIATPLAIVAAFLLAGPALAASDEALAPDHPERYTVKKGDTLWDIADRFLADPWLWPEVWHVNPQIDNPHLIYPGDVIRLVYVDGEPRLQVERGMPTKRLSPQMEAEPLDRAIPTIPLDAIRSFLERPRVVTKAQLDSAGYIVQSADEHLISGSGDRVYGRRLDGPREGQLYSVFRPGETYRDPETDEILGYEAIYVADARVERTTEPAALRLVRSRREARGGDRLLAARERTFDHHFTPHPPANDVEGQIISVVGGVSQVGQYQVVVLNRGRGVGMEPGHVLAVYQKGETIKDPLGDRSSQQVTLPDEKAGVVMIFRAFDGVSYALVMEATRAIHVNDRVRSPES